jgi:hypothetical protein
MPLCRARSVVPPSAATPHARPILNDDALQRSRVRESVGLEPGSGKWTPPGPAFAGGSRDTRLRVAAVWLASAPNLPYDADCAAAFWRFLRARFSFARLVSSALRRRS